MTLNDINVMGNTDGQCVTIMTENVPFHGVWIKGEGADICLYRAMDDNRIVGAHLPVRNWSGKIIS